MFAEAGAIPGTEGADSAVWWSRRAERDDALLAAWRGDLLGVAGRMLSTAARAAAKQVTDPGRGAPDAEDPEDRQYTCVEQPMHFCGFLQPGFRLVLGVRGWPPIGPRNRIYLVPSSALVSPGWHVPSEAVPVRSPEDLEGRVNIQTARDALQYVRLFTTPTVALRWGADVHWGEIVCERNMTPLHTFALGRTLYFAVEFHSWWAVPDGAWGLLSDQTWAEAKLRSPVVIAVPDGWVAIRWLYRLDSRGRSDGEAYLTAEAVSVRGQVHREVIETRDLGPGVGFFTPYPQM
jgi:hypothetical protein